MANAAAAGGPWPFSSTALAWQRHDRLTVCEADVIHAYPYNSHDVINRSLWGQIEMTPANERGIRLIRSTLAKYPLETAVRVTREVEAAEYGIVDEDSVHELIDEDVSTDTYTCSHAPALHGTGCRTARRAHAQSGRCSKPIPARGGRTGQVVPGTRSRP